MNKKTIFSLLTCLVVLLNTSFGNGASNKQHSENQQESTPVKLSLNIKKGFSCKVVYNAQIYVSQKGQSDGTGEWNVKANFLLKCDDVDEKGIMTISQSPIKITIEGTDIEEAQEIDFHAPEKNRQIPHLVQGFFPTLIAIKSAKLDTNGKIIAARQSPALDNYDFMMTGKISYRDDPEWILSNDSKAPEKAKYIASSMLGITPMVVGKEFSIGQTISTKKEVQNKGQTQVDLTLKNIKNHTAQIEVKANSNSESKDSNNEFVDEVNEIHDLSEGLLEINTATGLTQKSTLDTETEFRTMTFIPSLSTRAPTFSNTNKIHITTQIIE
ncbi:MAG: hypothetical protein ACYTFX_07910 [Planctomycetota bacterium]